MRLKSTIYESTLSTAARSPLPNGEGYETRIPLSPKHSLSCVGEARRYVANDFFNLIALQQGGRLRNEDAAFLALSERIHAYVEKKNNDGQSLPRVGKVASGASRIGF